MPEYSPAVCEVVVVKEAVPREGRFGAATLRVKLFDANRNCTWQLIGDWVALSEFGTYVYVG